MHADKECWDCSHIKSPNKLGVAVWMCTSLFQNNRSWLKNLDDWAFHTRVWGTGSVTVTVNFYMCGPGSLWPLNTSLLIADHIISVAKQKFMMFIPVCLHVPYLNSCIFQIESSVECKISLCPILEYSVPPMTSLHIFYSSLALLGLVNWLAH